MIPIELLSRQKSYQVNIEYDEPFHCHDNTVVIEIKEKKKIYFQNPCVQIWKINNPESLCLKLTVLLLLKKYIYMKTMNLHQSHIYNI